MNLTASVMVGRAETDRYLEPFLAHLLEFCDTVCVRSEDTSVEWTGPQTKVLMADPSFFRHEGRARQELLNFTMAQGPTHILAIDADEFVTDGQAIRKAVEQRGLSVWSLSMREIWTADDTGLGVRTDGGWRPHQIPILYNPHAFRRRPLKINDRALACGREPAVVAAMRGRARPSGSDILHLGWTCEADRAARHQRYVQHDGGKFHRNPHLDSIMWENGRVGIDRMPWPAALTSYKDRILERTGRGS